MSAKAKGAAGGVASGAMSGAAIGSIVPGIGTAIGAAGGAILGGLSGFLGSEEEVEPPTPEEMAQQSIGVQEIYLPALQRLRAQHNPELMRLGVEQTSRAQQGLSGISNAMAGDISRDRATLSTGDMDLFRSQSQGFQGAERLQQIMQQQAEEELRLNGRLSPEMQRNVDQMTMGQTMKQGRGAGAFNVGQLALSRQGAVQQRQDRARQFGSGVAQLGMQTSNPLQRFMGINAQMAGGLPQRMAQAQQFGEQNQVNFDPINAQIANVAMGSAQMKAAQNARSSSSFGDMLGGGLSMVGSMYAGGAFGGGGNVPQDASAHQVANSLNW